VSVLNRTPATGFPASARFVGPSGQATNDPRDLVVVTYGEVESFVLRMGSSSSRQNTNFFGVAFKEVGWGALTPVTTGEQLTLSYDANGATSGTVPASQTGSVGASITTRTNSGSLSLAGHTFGGWNTAPNGSGISYPAGSVISMPVGGGTLYALWAPVSYAVTYDANGGSGAPSGTSAQTGTTVTVSASTPTRSGYSFTGWNTAANGSGTSYAAGAAFSMPSIDVTLYAQWAPRTFLVAYGANGGSGAPANQPGVFDTTVTVSNTSPTRTGFTFAGWNTAADGSGSAYSGGNTFTMPPTHVTLHAQWTAIPYTLTYHANPGGSSPAASTHSYLEAVTLSAAVPTRAGYWFNGWNTLANGTGNAYTSSFALVMPASDIDLYAQWVPDTYRVVYNANGGAGAPVDQVEATDAAVTVSATTPTRTGHTFTGWNMAANGTGANLTANATFNMPPSNTTLYAQWQVIQFQVVRHPNGGTGTLPPNHTADYQTTVVIDDPTQLSRAGYTFTGWNTQADGTGIAYAPGFGFVIPAANTILYAQWFADTNAIVYDTTGGSGVPANDFAPTNTNVWVSSTVPTRTGYTFSHWRDAQGNQYSNPAAGTTVANFTMPSHSVVLYAVWTINSYTITFDANGGAGAPAGSTFDFGDPVTVPATSPMRGGFNFVGWNTALNGSGTAYASSVAFPMPANNVTLYAQWTAIPAPVSAPALVDRVARVFGSDRFATSVAVSLEFAVVGAPAVYVASGVSLADAMVAGSYAAEDGGSVLFVERDRVPAGVMGELRRLAPREVVVVGGHQVVAPSVEQSLVAAGFRVRRVAGADRYATAVALSKRGYASTVSTVYVASGVAFADAMPAGVLAAIDDGPVLLVTPGGVPAVTAAELVRLRPERIVIVGGPAEVGAAVEASLRSYAVRVVRVSGVDRYETAVALSQSRFDPGVPAVFVMSGDRFPDALAAVAPAGRLGGPILLSSPTCVPASVRAEIGRLQPGRIIIIGGGAVLGSGIDTLATC
jgi:uncharacterized repeat protein (TIGR02543 family)